MHQLAHTILGTVNPLEEVIAHELLRFDLWGITVIVTNHMFMITLAMLVLIIALPLSVRRKGLVPKGFANMVETVCVFIRQEVAQPFLGKSTDRHIGFIWTIFFFILTLNLLGMIPIGGIITLMTHKPNHFGGVATANIWVVGALAIVAFFAIHISGIRQQGIASYFKNFIPKVPWPMVPFIYLMEIIGALVKPVSLAIRLFANMFAGHMLIATLFIVGIIFKNYFAASLSVVAVVLASFLELLVAFVQAYIFTFLTAIFMGFAVNPEH